MKRMRPISTWKMFEKNVRVGGCNLLKKLDNFPASILVTGCQRSGTTMLSRIITDSDGMVNYYLGHDEELDAALILSGTVLHSPLNGRYCFQTTYLNECYQEYFEHCNGHKIIWLLRNPHSVIYSILNNWRYSALNRLFNSCGKHLLEGFYKKIYQYIGLWGIPRLHRACLAYNGKVSQLFELTSQLKSSQLIIINYEDLIINSQKTLLTIYKHIDLKYKNCYSNVINSRSLIKSKKLSNKQKNYINSYCLTTYSKAKKLSKII